MTTNNPPLTLLQPDMSILNVSHYAQPVFPLYVLPDRLQEWLQESERATGAPIDYSAGAILAACAASIGNSCNVAINPKWHEPSNLFISLVGAPASGKTPAETPIFKLIHEMEDSLNSNFEQDMTAYQNKLAIAKIAEKRWKQWVCKAMDEGEIKPEKPPEAIYPQKPTRKRLIAQDATLEQFIKIQQENSRGVLLARDELTGWLSGMTRYKSGDSTDRPFWLEAHAGAAYTVDRVKHSDDPIKVPRLAVSLLGGIQPDKLKRIVNDDDDGLVARLLYIWPQRGEIVPYTTGADIKLIKYLFNRLHYHLLDKAKPTSIAFNADGENGFLEFRKRMQWGAQYHHGPLAGMYGKAAGHAARLALVLTLIEWALSGQTDIPKVIPYQTQYNAMALMEHYFIPMAYRVLDSVTRPKKEGYGRILATWLINNKLTEITKRDIYKVKRISGLSSAAKAQHAIDELVDAKWLHPADRDASHTGRPTERYLVNPSIYPTE